MGIFLEGTSGECSLSSVKFVREVEDLGVGEFDMAITILEGVGMDFMGLMEFSGLVSSVESETISFVCGSLIDVDGGVVDLVGEGQIMVNGGGGMEIEGVV